MSNIICANKNCAMNNQKGRCTNDFVFLNYGGCCHYFYDDNGMPRTRPFYQEPSRWEVEPDRSDSGEQSTEGEGNE